MVWNLKENNKENINNLKNINIINDDLVLIKESILLGHTEGILDSCIYD